MIGRVGQINPFFNNYSNKQEQWLYESLVNEAIQIYGVPCIYIARNFTSFDQLYGATESESYTYSWPLAIYQKNVLGFAGDKEFMDKFAGLQIRDQVVFSIPRLTFDQVIGQDSNFPPLPPQMEAQGEANRPREGDLIWYPFNRKCFKIVFVNLTDMFWQLGKLFTWEVTCELYEYSGEQFNTGIPEIDRIQKEGSLNVLDWTLTDTNGTPILFDPFTVWVVDRFAKIYPLQDNAVIDVEANNYVAPPDWGDTNVDPFSDAGTGTNPSPTI